MITRIFGAVTGGLFNLRAAADSSASILASIPDGTLLVVTEHNDTWYAATYGSYTGFVMKQYITLLNLANATELPGEVTGGALNIRRTASTTADCLIQIPNNTAITVIDFDADSQWYITDYNDYTGYVMKQYVSVTQPVPNWAYGQVTSDALNVRRQPSTSAARWNNVWPLNRIVLIKDAVEGWYESLYRGQPAYVVKDYINVLDTPVHASIVDRMLFMVTPELGRDNVIYFNGYSGEWCHRFADWLAMNAGMPIDMIPNDSNCGTGMVWFINNANSGGFHFKSAEHISVPENDDIKSLLDKAKGTWLGGAILLGACCGLRRSEICGLKVEDIDCKKNTIYIRRTVLKDDSGKWIVREGTKTTKSKRKIEVAP